MNTGDANHSRILKTSSYLLIVGISFLLLLSIAICSGIYQILTEDSDVGKFIAYMTVCILLAIIIFILWVIRLFYRRIKVNEYIAYRIKNGDLLKDIFYIEHKLEGLHKDSVSIRYFITARSSTTKRLFRTDKATFEYILEHSTYQIEYLDEYHYLITATIDHTI